MFRFETERLILREHRPDDLPGFLRLWSDPGVFGFLTGRPLTEEEVWLRLLRHRGAWAMLGYGFLVLQEKASGRLVGEVGFQELKRASEPSYAGTPEMGWGLGSDHRGHGLAREAVDVMLDWADRQPALQHTVCIIHPDNQASIRLALRVGYRPAGEVASLGRAWSCFARSAPGPG
jgi:RimJ/RimL family protein N-acetyltransferase